MRTRVIWTAIGMLACGAVLTGANVWAAANTSSTLVTCKKVTPCVDNKLTAINLKLNTLSLRVANLRKRNRTLNACLAEFPITKQTTYDNWDYPYYNSSLANASEAPGFYNDQTSESQPINDILQQTQSGWSVDYWFVQDTCTPSTYTRPPAP